MFGFGKKKEVIRVEPKVEVKEVQKIVFGDLEKVVLYKPTSYDQKKVMEAMYPYHHLGYIHHPGHYTESGPAFDRAGEGGYVRRVEAYKVGDTYLAADGWKELEVKE